MFRSSRASYKTKVRFFILGLLLSASWWTFAAPGPDCMRIGQITINSFDIFKDDSKAKWYHKAFQKLHWETRDRVIAREFLFKVGDCYDPELVAETERNLRNASIFDDAYITAEVDEAAGVVNLAVTTRDRFTLRTNFSFSRKGGINKTQVRIGETNLLGLNKALKFTYENRSDGSRVRRYTYDDPRLVGDIALKTIYSRTDEGYYRQLDIGRPFRRLDDRFSYNLAYQKDQTKSDFYTDGGSNIKIPNDLSRLSLGWSQELGSRSFSKQISMDLGYREERYGETPGIEIPEPLEAFPLLFTWSQRKRKAFIVCQEVDSLIKREDISLHTGLSFAGGAEYRRDRGWYPLFGASWDKTAQPNEDFLSVTSINGRIRFRGNQERTSELETFQHVYYFMGSQTLVGGAAYNYSFTKDDLYLPLTLGEDQGLRGYKAFSFTGNKRLLVNLEHRLTYPWRTKRMAFGQVLFVDGGNTWKPGEQPGRLNWSSGIGFRVDAPALFGHKVLRLDLALPLEGGDLSVSFTIGQIFNHNTVNRGFDKDF